MLDFTYYYGVVENETSKSSSNCSQVSWHLLCTYRPWENYKSISSNPSPTMDRIERLTGLSSLVCARKKNKLKKFKKLLGVCEFF